MKTVTEQDEASAVFEAINKIVELRLKEFRDSLRDEVTAKVNTLSPLTVYINNDEIPIDVKNPRDFVLTLGQLVKVRFPNFKNDANRYIDRVVV